MLTDESGRFSSRLFSKVNHLKKIEESKKKKYEMLRKREQLQQRHHIKSELIQKKNIYTFSLQRANNWQITYCVM